MALELTGWFQVAWSGDIGPEQVIPLRYFGRDLVGYRGKDGAVHIQDRHCRHLGASLAHGGKVVDEGIRCPFHGWVWGPDGQNVSIPYQDRPSRARRLGSWPVMERNESIYMWHDHAGRDPFFDVPDCLTFTAHGARAKFHPAWPEGTAHFRDLRVHPAMVIENSVDPQHFKFVHGTPLAPVVLEENVDGPYWQNRVGFGNGWIQHARDAEGNLRRDSLNTLEAIWAGIGASVNMEHTRAGMRGILINTTPVEDGKSEIFATYWIDKQDGDLENGSYRRRLNEAKAALPDDVTIWNNQVYLEPPVLASTEGAGFRKMRRWAKQFYPGGQGVTGPTGVSGTRTPSAETAQV
jgi:3-ketosteroid 9alpha-monooxygenase subunit A